MSSEEKPCDLAIRDLAQLLEHVEQKCVNGLYLYRGQPVDRPLIPKIGRPVSQGTTRGEEILLREKRLLGEFKRRSRSALPRTIKNDWDLLAVAQHSGLATRLLDWTENPLAALWFAIRKHEVKEGPSVLWVFEVPEEDVVARRAKDSPFKGVRTRVFQPYQITRTIVAQGGWFTVHKYMGQGKGFVPLERNKLYKECLKKLTIERRYWVPLAKSLDRCGINASSMFPDLSGLCEYLNWKEPPDSF
jgi:hypothetical protein